MLGPMSASPKPPAAAVHVACLCAAWCRLCDDYAPVFERVTQALQTACPGLQTHWIDIEDEAELLGDFDVETFPTLVVVVGDELRFAGPLTPQPETLQRVLASVLAAAQPGLQAAQAVQAFARRLRLRSA